MVIVALAGGSGGVGRTFLDAFAKSGQHNVIVLSRTVSWSSDANYQYYCTKPRQTANDTAHSSHKRLAVDYENVDNIKRVLQEQKVEVVISCLLLLDDGSARSQINLIRAAAQSRTVDRFIPTEYYLNFHAPIPGSDLFVDFQLQAEEELLQHPQLTFTLIRAGIFLDHLAMPYNPKKTHMVPYWMFIDMDHEECVFPGDGSYPLILTHSTDLAAFIVRLASLPAKDWPRESLVASNRLHVKDLDAVIKRVTGKSFKITFDSEEAVRVGHITTLPSNEAVFSDPTGGELLRKVEHQIMLSMLSRAHNLPGQNLAELFPDVVTTNIYDFLRASWEIKQSSKTR